MKERERERERIKGCGRIKRCNGNNSNNNINNAHSTRMRRRMNNKDQIIIKRGREEKRVLSPQDRKTGFDSLVYYVCVCVSGVI